MVAPVIQSEGVRVGGVMTTKAAFVGRTNSDGVNLTVELFLDKLMVGTPVGSVTTASLTVDNNYQATCYATGLIAGTKYYWRVKVDDGAGGITYGADRTNTGEFKTLSALPTKTRLGFGSCVIGSEIISSNKSILGSYVFQNILNLNLDYRFAIGDTYYPDSGSPVAGSDYVPGTWRVPATHAEGTLAAFRTNFISTYGGLPVNGYPNTLAELCAQVATYYMVEDHDRAKNNIANIDALTGDEKLRVQNGMQVSHECFVALNKELIEQEPGRTFDFYSSPDAYTDNNKEDYYYVDISSARIIMTNNRNFRGNNSETDSESKAMYGAKQEQWLYDAIDSNPNKYLIIVFGAKTAGDRAFNATSNDNMTSYSYERNRIFNYIWENGDPTKTLIIVGDTHASAIYTHHHDNKPPIYVACCAAMFDPASTGEGLTIPTNVGSVADAGGDADILYFGSGTDNVIGVVDLSISKMKFTLFKTLHSIPSSTATASGHPRRMVTKAVWSRVYA